MTRRAGPRSTACVHTVRKLDAPWSGQECDAMFKTVQVGTVWQQFDRMPRKTAWMAAHVKGYKTTAAKIPGAERQAKEKAERDAARRKAEQQGQHAAPKQRPGWRPASLAPAAAPGRPRSSGEGLSRLAARLLSHSPNSTESI